MKVCVIQAYQTLNNRQYPFFPDENALGCHLFDGTKAIYQEGRRRGYVIYTPENTSSIFSADVIVFQDWNSENQMCELAQASTAPKVYIQSELPQHLPLPQNVTFELFFSYSEMGFRENTRPFNYSVNLDPHQFYTQADRDTIITMFATNFYKAFEGELYSARREAAIAAHHIFGHHFELYGRGWEPTGLNSRGFVQDKADILRRAQFTICFENCFSHKGYVTEKILEPIFYGSIPIYFCDGHSKNKIPRDVFINPLDFESISDLLHHCKNMSQSERECITKSGYDWMRSEKFTLFNSKSSAVFFWDSLESLVPS
jgi:hypothetical protein